MEKDRLTNNIHYLQVTIEPQMYEAPASGLLHIKMRVNVNGRDYWVMKDIPTDPLESDIDIMLKMMSEQVKRLIREGVSSEEEGTS